MPLLYCTQAISTAMEKHITSTNLSLAPYSSTHIEDEIDHITLQINNMRLAPESNSENHISSRQITHAVAIPKKYATPEQTEPLDLSCKRTVECAPDTKATASTSPTDATKSGEDTSTSPPTQRFALHLFNEPIYLY